MQHRQKDLARTLTRNDLVLLLVGTVIGSGIFLVPGGVLQQSGGHVGLALLVWLIGGVLSLLGALTYGELGAMRAAPGGLYLYIRDAFGPLPAFLYGWTSFFVLGAGSVATLAVAFTRYLQQFVTVSPVVAKMVAVLVIVVVMAVNVRGARQGADVQNVTTAIKAGAIVVMSILLLALGTWPATGAAADVTGATGSLFTGVGL